MSFLFSGWLYLIKGGSGGGCKGASFLGIGWRENEMMKKKKKKERKKVRRKKERKRESKKKERKKDRKKKG